MSGYVKKSSGYVIGKTPLSELDYSLDWSLTLESGETLVSATWAADTGITASLPVITGNLTTVWLSGGTLAPQVTGTPATQYGVSCKVMTSANRVDERGFFVQIKTPQQLSL